MWIWIIVALAILLFIGLGYRWPWTGFGETSYTKARGTQEVQPKKTLWDWLDLLIVPAVLGLGALWFAAQQDERQAVAEERRAKAVQEAEDQRAQAEALQTYIDEMALLMLDNQQPLREATTGEEPVVVARARTLSLLDRLDPKRKVSVLLFLYEAELIGLTAGSAEFFGANGPSSDEPTPPVVRLYSADLSGLSMEPGTYLRGVDMWGADLTDADLSGAVLYGADLDYAKLNDAKLDGANLAVAELRAVNLDNTSLEGADLTGAALAGYKDASGDFPGADLTGADLTRADLTNADVTEAQLEQAESLKGATMPNGQKYEEWLKSKGRGEDG